GTRLGAVCLNRSQPMNSFEVPLQGEQGEHSEACAENSGVQLAALLYLLSRAAMDSHGPDLTLMTLQHLDMLAVDQNVSPVIRTTCAGIARQWREAGGMDVAPAVGTPAERAFRH